MKEPEEIEDQADELQIQSYKFVNERYERHNTTVYNIFYLSIIFIGLFAPSVIRLVFIKGEWRYLIYAGIAIGAIFILFGVVVSHFREHRETYRKRLLEIEKDTPSGFCTKLMELDESPSMISGRLLYLAYYTIGVFSLGVAIVTHLYLA